METSKNQYILEGLCCGNCATKIEKDVKLLQGVRNATIDVSTTVLSVEFDTDSDKLGDDIEQIAITHDEDIVVKEKISN